MQAEREAEWVKAGVQQVKEHREGGKEREQRGRSGGQGWER
jgi:hypothetical protein